MTCRACPAEITWAINLDTNKRIPLVPAEEGARVRYRLNDRGYCAKDPEGAWLSHFENCPGATQFHKEKRK